MHVVLDTADLYGMHYMVLGDAGHIGPQFWLEPFTDRPDAVVRAEYHMNVIADKGAAHDVSSPPGLEFSFTRPGTSVPGYRLFRRYATDNRRPAALF